MSVSLMVWELAKAFINTILIFGLTLAFSLPAGLIVLFLKKSRLKIVPKLTAFYISIMRGTPLILQLMVVYYGPNLLFKISVSASWRFSAVIVAFVLNYAAYFAEIYRGGIEAIDLGQYQAAEILGYNKFQSFMVIILPQMIKIVLPSLGGEIINLVKDTSIAYAIGVVEMFTKAKQIAVAPGSPGLLTLAVAGVFYYIFNAVVSLAIQASEKALGYYR